MWAQTEVTMRGVVRSQESLLSDRYRRDPRFDQRDRPHGWLCCYMNVVYRYHSYHHHDWSNNTNVQEGRLLGHSIRRISPFLCGLGNRYDTGGCVFSWWRAHCREQRKLVPSLVERFYYIDSQTKNTLVNNKRSSRSCCSLGTCFYKRGLPTTTSIYWPSST